MIVLGRLLPQELNRIPTMYSNNVLGIILLQLSLEIIILPTSSVCVCNR